MTDNNNNHQSNDGDGERTLPSKRESDSGGSEDRNSFSAEESNSPGNNGNKTNSLRTRRRINSHHNIMRRIQQDCASGMPTMHKVHDPFNPQGSDDGFGSSDFGDPEEWFEKHIDNFKATFQRKSCGDWLATILPMYSWLKTYSWRGSLLTDIIAGLTVGVMIIPQSMSYAKLAGLPVEFGLYSSLVPLYAYALFGSSRQLAVGPVALVSLLLNTGLTLALESAGKTPENTPNYDEIYATMAIQTSFLVGICYILMGVLRLGFVTILLSHAVVSGFTSAAAIIIGLSQVKYILGYDVASDKVFHNMLKNIFSNIGKFHWRSFLLGSSCVFFLIGLKKAGQKFPQLKWAKALGPLIVTVFTIVLQATVDLEDKGIKIIGFIPRGLPKISVKDAVAIKDFGQLSVVVISIVIVGFMESIAIAKQLATKNNYEIDASKEFLGLGMANLTAGLFSGYPVTGSFSRSAVNNDAGAKSGISAVVTATVVGLVLLFLTPVFELLSLPTLAAIVISGVVSLVDYEEAIYLWKVHRFDFGVWMFAFVGTLFLGVELGLGLAVGLSLLLVVFESAYPHTAILGRLPGTTEYRNVKNYPQAECYDNIVVVRIDAPIYFANTHQVREKVQKYVDKAKKELADSGSSNQAVQFIILELNAVPHIDTAGLHTLQDMNAVYKNRKIQLCFTNPNTKVMGRLIASGLVEDIGRDHIFVSTHDAVNHCLGEMVVKENSQDGEPAEIFPLTLEGSEHGGSIDDDRRSPMTSSELSEGRDVEAGNIVF